MRAQDVNYTQTSEYDHTHDLETLDKLMDIGNFSDIQKVCFTVSFRFALDRAYNAGLEAGYY